MKSENELMTARILELENEARESLKSGTKMCREIDKLQDLVLKQQKAIKYLKSQVAPGVSTSEPKSKVNNVRYFNKATLWNNFC